MNFLNEVSGPPITKTLSSNWIFDRIEEWAQRFPDRFAFAVDHQDKVTEFGYADVLAEAAGIAAELEAKGIKRGDRVGILMENIPQWVFVLLGAMRLGAVTVPLATTLPESSIRLFAEHAGCRVLFADEPNMEKASAVAKQVGCELVPCTEIRNPPSAIRNFPTPSPDDTALIIYTSGTTGDPKGVELTLSNLIHEIQGAIESLEISPDHRILSVLPFSHILPLIAAALGPLCVGAGVVFLASISPQRIVDAFHRHRITFFICVPQFFYLLHKRIFSQVAAQPLPMRLVFRSMQAASRRLNNASLRRKLFAKIHNTIGPDLRLLASGGSRFDPRVAQDLNDLGYTMLQAYGLTETAAAATATPASANRIGTVGKPLRGVTVRIDSPNEEGVGEVWIRGPVLMKGYYRDGVKTAEAIQDGWLHTGDLGFIGADGNLTITGRSKDVIVLSNGKNIYPEEIETHYSQSPYIKEMCVLGVTEDGDEPSGESLHAVIVPDMDEFRSRGQTAIMEMIRFEIENLSKQVPSYHRIHSLSVRNEALPRTVTRKLKRFEIQKDEAARRGAQPEGLKGDDHPRFQEKVGSVIAELVREIKPEAGALVPSMNLELDLGFDSLTRVELLGLVEARLGIHIDEQEATRIFTLGELIDAFETSTTAESSAGRSWKEILEVGPADELHRHYILGSRTIVNPLALLAMRLLRLSARMFFRMRCYGLEKIPQKLPFIICPNHESFLDGPLLVSTMPRRVIYKMFILGYSDYWASAVSRRIAQLCNIVAIDPNVNLIRAMQVGAIGLSHGRVLLVFPEGTRSIDGRVAEFKKGAAILSYELGVPIVPVGIRGSFESWPRGGSFRFHPVEIYIGDPIDPITYSQAADPYAALTEELQSRVKVLSDDAKMGSYGNNSGSDV
jgi:long-chain acyl-CoA synthetase